MITLLCIMLIGPYYEYDIVFDMILSDIYMNLCEFEFLSVHRRKICLIIYFRIKLKALSATETKIDYANAIGKIFKAYGEI